MYDICERLRSTPRADIREVMREAADEIERLLDALDEQTGRAEWNYECVTRCEEKVIQRDAEIDRLRLTDAERRAIQHIVDGGPENIPADIPHHEALRGLLERLG
jgi:hypothetical protein